MVGDSPIRRVAVSLQLGAALRTLPARRPLTPLVLGALAPFKVLCNMGNGVTGLGLTAVCLGLVWAGRGAGKGARTTALVMAGLAATSAASALISPRARGGDDAHKAVRLERPSGECPAATPAPPDWWLARAAVRPDPVPRKARPTEAWPIVGDALQKILHLRRDDGHAAG